MTTQPCCDGTGYTGNLKAPCATHYLHESDYSDTMSLTYWDIYTNETDFGQEYRDTTFADTEAEALAYAQTRFGVTAWVVSA